MVYGDKKNNGCDLNKSINTERLEGTTTKVQAQTEMLDLKNILRNGSENADIEASLNSEKSIELHFQPSTSQHKQHSVYIRNACKRYGSKSDSIDVLNGLNMTVPKGVIYGLMGASGCGKTTLLSCIVGQRKLNSGEIWVLDGIPGSEGSGIPGTRIGYMPQDTALYGEITIRETLVFFGWIAGMTTEKIQERLEFLVKLLMIPKVDEMTKNLSGGQQRRLSLASALIHEPELLILDEPTVGLDPVLRENIWNHFLDITRDGLTTVVITTHYVDETRRAHRISLMRGGYFLVEESPEKLLNQYGVETLGEIFFKLSEIQNTENCQHRTDNPEAIGVIAQATSVNHNGTSTITVSDASDSKKGESSSGDLPYRHTPKTSPERKIGTRISDYLAVYNKNHMKTLFWKNFLWSIRNMPLILTILVLPIILSSAFCVCVGNNPTDLSIAVVNYETNNVIKCEDKLTCNTSQLSCYYFEYLKRHNLILIPYDSEEDARESVLKGKTYASIVVKNNYSAALHVRVQNWQDSTPWDIASSEIDVFRDVSNKLIANHIKSLLYDAFQSFFQDYLESCDMESKWLTLPISWKFPIYGVKYSSFTDFVIPGFLATFTFMLSSGMTVAVMMIERNEGWLERLLVIGITKIELLASHLMCQFVIMVLQSVMSLTCLFAVFKITLNGSLFLVVVLTLLIGLCGLCFGLCISCACSTERTAYYVVIGSIFPLIMLSGFIWPVEGVHNFLKPLAFGFPVTKAIESLRSIMQRGWGFSTEIVYMGFIEITIWTIIFLAISILILKFKKG